MKKKVIFWILFGYLALHCLDGVVSFARTYRRYKAPKEYSQRITQEHLDDMAKRLDRLERGQQ